MSNNLQLIIEMKKEKKAVRITKPTETIFI